MCRLSAVSYFDQSDVKNRYLRNELVEDLKSCPKLIEGDLSNDYSIIQNDCQVYTCKYKDSLVFAFRGTESFRDVLSDLNIFRTNLTIPNVQLTCSPKVHSGFLTQFNTVKEEMSTEIQVYRENTKNDNSLIFTGHSLGGGLATIASVYYGLQYPDMNVKCITFGSPRVGNSDFVKLFDKRVNESHRLVNEDDPVPMGPTPFIFTHVCGGEWIKDAHLINERPIFRSVNFVKNFVGSIFGFVSNPVSDHNCDHYLDVVKCCDDNK